MQQVLALSVQQAPLMQQVLALSVQQVPLMYLLPQLEDPSNPDNLQPENQNNHRLTTQQQRESK
jgi:hypothetical protein